MPTVTIASVLKHPKRPFFRVSPSITGTFAAGNTLTYDLGEWVAAPSAVATRVDTYINGELVPGYGFESYDLTGDESGGTIQIGVVIENAVGITSRLSPVYNIDVLTLGTPVISSDSLATATTKTIDVDLPDDIAEDDVLEIEHAATDDFSGATADTYTILAADVTAGTYAWDIAGLSVGQRYFRARNTRGVVDGAWSDTLSLPVVPSAPTATITTASDDNTPTVRVALNADHIATYVIRVEWSASNEFLTLEQSAEHTIVAGDVTATFKDLTATTLADGLWYVRAYVRASATLIGPWSNVDSETIATVVTSGAPVLADQTLLFGRNTLAGIGRFLVNTGGAITSIDSFTGTDATHFTAASNDGKIVTAGTRGKANPLNASYTINVTASNAFGSDSCVLTIITDADAYEYETTTQLTNAIENARPGTNGSTAAHTTDFTFYQVEGTAAGGSTTSYYLRGKTMAGTMTEPNSGVTTNTAYDHDAVMAVSGGSLRITCRTNRGATFLSRFFCTGSGPVIIDGLILGGANSAGTKSASNTTYQIVANVNAANQAKNKFAVINSTLGGTAIGTAQNFWCRTGDISMCDVFIFEDNIIDGGYAGLKITDNSITTFRRNAVRKIVWDHIFFNMGYGANTTDATIQLFVTGNTLWDRKRPSFPPPGPHADAFQSGVAASDQDPTFNNKPLVRVISRNIWDFTAENLGTESYAQGYFEAYFNNAFTSTTGEICYNLFICEAPNGVTVSASVDTEIFNNTCIFNTNAAPFSGGGLVRGGQWSSGILSNWTDNIFCESSVPFNEGAAITTSGNVHVNPYDDAISTRSYESNFAGTFNRTANGPEFAYDEDDAATVRAALIAWFTPKAGSICEGKGFTVGIA